jgi:hypothetical protein
MSDLRLNGGGELELGDADMTVDEPRTLDIEIDPPITLADKKYETLHLAEPTAKMVEIAERELGANMSVHALRRYQIALVAQGAKVPVPVVERMLISKVREGADFLASFIGGGPATGET